MNNLLYETNILGKIILVLPRVNQNSNDITFQILRSCNKVRILYGADTAVSYTHLDVYKRQVNHLANRTEVNRVKQEAAELTQTLAAFMGSSGHSVKIWLRFTRPDKSLPKSLSLIHILLCA